MRPFLEQVGSRWIVNDGRKRLPGYHRSRNAALAAMHELREASWIVVPPSEEAIKQGQEIAERLGLLDQYEAPPKPTRTRTRVKR